MCCHENFDAALSHLAALMLFYRVCFEATCFSSHQRDVIAFPPRSQPWTLRSILRFALKKRVHGIQLLNQLETS